MRATILKKLLVILFLQPFFSVASASEKAAQPEIPSIQELPRLQAGLKPGTIAWATPDQLHPTQPQTGIRAALRKLEKNFRPLLAKNKNNFSKELYEFAFERSVAPVYIAKTPRDDSRFGRQNVLGYITDRTHGSFAQSQLIEEVYGSEALIDPLFDKKGRPLNFILVKVMADESESTTKEFEDFMIKNKHCYLNNWSRSATGETIISPIAFGELPEQVLETTDNPFRGLVGDLQHEKELDRSSENFSQFTLAEALLKSQLVAWDEIKLTSSKKDYARAFKRAADFFDSKDIQKLLQQRKENSGTNDFGPKCQLLF